MDARNFNDGSLDAVFIAMVIGIAVVFFLQGYFAGKAFNNETLDKKAKIEQRGSK